MTRTVWLILSHVLWQKMIWSFPSGSGKPFFDYFPPPQFSYSEWPISFYNYLIRINLRETQLATVSPSSQEYHNLTINTRYIQEFIKFLAEWCLKAGFSLNEQGIIIPSIYMATKDGNFVIDDLVTSLRKHFSTVGSLIGRV